MFKIYGNRPELWQWDVGQKLIVEDERISEVHFCDGINSQALVCEVYELEGQRVVNIPNVVLQDNCDMTIFTYFNMNIFAYVKDQDGSYTKHREIIKVNKRSKPTDYVYTETEVKRYETLEKRIDEIEKNGVSNEAIAGAVEEYLNENPIEIPEGDFAKKSDIPTKVSQLTNDSSYASENYVTNAIANAQLGGGNTGIDLSGYATKDDLSNKVDKVTGKSLIADSEITRLANVTNYDDTGIKNTLNTKADKSAIPTKVSQLSNDKNYLTSVPSTYKTKTENDALYQPKGNYLTSVPSEYVTKTELNNKGYLTSKLKDKKITVVGDSLSTGYTVGENWANMLAQRTGAIVTNLATDGATIAFRDDDNGNNFISKLELIPTDSDYIVFMGGGNDMMKSLTPGTKNDKDNVRTTGGAVFQSIAYCQQNIPTAKVMYITEPPIGAEMHDAYDPYLNIIMEICEMGHIPCFNMHANFGLNPNIPQIREIYWLDDYVHLTETGQQYMSKKIQNFLENEVVNNNKNANSLNGYKLMILSASEYASLSKKDANTIYITKDNKAYLGSLLILGGGTSSGGDSGNDTPNEGAIDQNLWNTFFKIKKYAGVNVVNNNPTLEFSGGATGAQITNLSEEEAVYSYNAAISHVATTLEVGKTITVELEVESTNVKTFNIGFYHSGGTFGTLTQIGSQQGTFTVSIKNTTSSTLNINGIGCMIDVNDSSGYTVKMTVKSITIA